MAPRNQTESILIVCRIIMAAMIASVVIFAVVTAVMVPGEDSHVKSELSSVLFPVLIAFAGSGILASFVIHPVLLNQARRAVQDLPADTEDINATGVGVALRYWQTYMIISAAVAESLGFFAVIVYMVTLSRPVLLMAGLSVLLLVMRFPTRGRIKLFVSHASGLPAEHNLP